MLCQIENLSPESVMEFGLTEKLEATADEKSKLT